KPGRLVDCTTPGERKLQLAHPGGSEKHLGPGYQQSHGSKSPAAADQLSASHCPVPETGGSEQRVSRAPIRSIPCPAAAAACAVGWGSAVPRTSARRYLV